mgnify:CR=1 FL=1
MITRNTFQLRKKRKEKENRHRATERPISSLLGLQWVEWTCNPLPI